MKKKSQFVLFAALLLMFGMLFTQEKMPDFPVIKGPYLGQKPPGMKAEVFAPGIVSTDRHEGCSGFAEDGNMYVFSRYRVGILIMEQKGGVWTRPYPAPFSMKDLDGDFCVSPDGKKVFIASGRPLTRSTLPTRNHNIWVVERTADGWANPRPLEAPVNTGWHESYPSVTRDGTLYFFKRDRDPGGQADIYRSKLVDGTYRTIEKLGGLINTEYNDLDAFVAPDEGYLIFCSDRPEGYGGADFYIVFKTEDGSWTDPVNMGEEINSSAAEWIPSVTPDGKYFFFTSNKSGNREIYWISAEIFHKLKPAVQRKAGSTPPSMP